MTRDDMEIVSALQIALADKVGQERFELWFGASTRLDVRDDSLIVSVPTQFFQEFLRQNFRIALEAACLETLGKALTLRFLVDPALAEARGAAAARQPAKVDHSARSAGAVSAEREQPAETPRRPFADLGSFVVGPSNRLAHAAAQSVAERLGASSPLVIHGPTSSGKTHLLEGIWTAARLARPKLQSVYLSAEQFTTLFLGALHGSGLPSFRRKYRGLDLLIVDDIHFLAGKRATLVELLHTIDSFLREGRQLVFAMDRPPNEMNELGLELSTRLQGGLVCGVQAPEYETRLGIARRMALRMNLSVPEDVLVWLAANLASHARELAGALNLLQATSQAWGAPIALPMAEEALSEMLRRGARSVRLVDIEQAVCQTFGLEPKSLQSNRKGKVVSHPRMLAMWLARKHTRAALSEIGHYFGRRSHSTVISAQKKVNDWMASHLPLELADGNWNVDDAIRRVEQNLRAG